MSLSPPNSRKSEDYQMELLIVKVAELIGL